MNVINIMSTRPYTISKGASVDYAMDLMDEHGIRHLPVTDEHGLVGVISDRDLLEATGWLHPRQREVLEAKTGAVEAFMHAPPIAVSPEADLDEALELMVKHRIGCLPVADGAELHGVVSEMDILREYANACLADRIAPTEDPLIEAFVSRDPVTITADASGDEAAAKLNEAGLRHLPVVEGSTLVGLVSDRDVRRLRGRGQLELTLVGEMMSPEPQTAQLDERLSSAARILAAEAISSLPVLEKGELVGIATLLDVMIPCAHALQVCRAR